MKRPIVSAAMRWLLWKDYRHSQLIVRVALFLLVVPYALATVYATVGSLRGGHAMGWWRGVWTDNFLSAFLVAGFFSLTVMQLTLALFGGHTIAGERTDGSAEFLCLLPISRGRKLASKLWIGLGLWTLAWLPNLMVMAAILCSSGDDTSPVWRAETIRGPVGIAVTGLTFFCVAWMFSAMLESATFAAGAGLVAPPLVATCMALGHGLLPYLGLGGSVSAPSPYAGYVGPCLLISIVCFTVGTRYYLRRVEP